MHVSDGGTSPSLTHTGAASGYSIGVRHMNMLSRARNACLHDLAKFSDSQRKHRGLERASNLYACVKLAKSCCLENVLGRNDFAGTGRGRGYLKSQQRVKADGWRSPTSGFTILEVITVVAMIGILSVLAAPGWLSFQTNRRLAAAQDEMYQALRLAQHEAKHRRVKWQVSFQNVDGQGQWAIHSVNTPPVDAVWNIFPDGVEIDDDETTAREDDGFYEVQFNSHGHVNGQLGRVTVKASNGSRLRRCVFVSTLLGAMRKARENRTPQSGRYCY